MQSIQFFIKKMKRNQLLGLIFLFCVHFSCNPKVEFQTISNIVGASAVCMLETNIEYSLTVAPDVDYVLWTVPEQAQIVSGQGTSKIKVNFGRKEGSVCAQLFTDGEVASDVQCFDVTFGVSGNWCRDIDIPGVTRINYASFTINDKFYIACGAVNPGDTCKDVWEFDPLNHSWTQKQSFPGPHRISAAQFSIGNNGYICAGYNALIGQNLRFYNDLWEYDALANNWLEKDTLPGVPRQYPFGFSIGNSGFVGGGQPGLSGVLSDLYEYNSTTQTWIQKQNTPFVRFGAATFVVNNKAYLCSGTNGNSYFNNLYEYGFLEDVWTEKSPLPDTVRYQLAGFSIADRGYICGGYDGGHFFSDLWEYSPFSNEWIQRASNPKQRAFPLSFVVKNKAYVAGGVKEGLQKHNDMWVYTP